MKKLEDYKIMPIFPGAPVSDPQVSPSGTKTLFTYTEVNIEENRYSSHIWLQDHRRKRPVQYTHGNGGESTPRWSPTGRRFLFLSGRHGERDMPEDKPKPQLFVMSASGGEAEKITYMDEAVMGPEWSPKGGRIMFSARVFKGEKASEDSDVKIIRRIKYRFDGKGYFEGKYVHLFTVSARGGKARQLTDGEYDVESYTWSSDGEKVAFVAAMGEDADLTHLRDVYTVPAKGGEPELLLKGQGPVDNLAWSPDGGYLAFTGRVLEDPDLVFYRNTEVFVLPIGGGEPRCLTTGFDRTVRGGLKWSPDGGSLYFLFPDKGSTQVGRVDLEGNVERVTEGKMNIGSFTLARKGGVMVYSATDDSSPSELWIRNSKGAKKRTELNRKLLRKLKWSQPEEFWFKASDGADVQGWIVKPHGYEEGVRYPTVLQVHGGPRGAYGYAMDAATHEFQVLAAYGYAVVYTNPRASVGYGEEFSAVVSGHWGERDYMDVMEAVDHVVESYDYVDGSRLGIAGGSYGGYMTNWVIGHTDRFRAAATMRSISNWYSMWGTSDISYRSHDVSWGKDPWDNVDEVMAKSPITFIGNAVTPTLIIHSEEDYRCPMEQDEQLFTALKKLGVPTEFIRFPGEPHGLSRTGKPRHRVERLQHIVRWFDRYLRD